MNIYRVSVNYRTTFSGGTWIGTVRAETEDEAIDRAHEIVRRKHGCKYFRIDGGDIELSGWNNDAVEKLLRQSKIEG